MKKSVNQHIGSDFEDFLAEEGLLNDANAVSIKCLLAWQIQNEMKNQHINKTNMAKRMQTSRSSLDRLLDEHDTSLTLSTLTSAAQALGKKVKIELVAAV